jgi:hypothetical protein
MGNVGDSEEEWTVGAKGVEQFDVGGASDQETRAATPAASLTKHPDDQPHLTSSPIVRFLKINTWIERPGHKPVGQKWHGF